MANKEYRNIKKSIKVMSDLVKNNNYYEMTQDGGYVFRASAIEVAHKNVYRNRGKKDVNYQYIQCLSSLIANNIVKVVESSVPHEYAETYRKIETYKEVCFMGGIRPNPDVIEKYLAAAPKYSTLCNVYLYYPINWEEWKSAELERIAELMD